MKNHLVLIGTVALALGACDKKQEVSQSAPPPPKKKTFGTDTRSSFQAVAVPQSKPGASPSASPSPVAHVPIVHAGSLSSVPTTNITRTAEETAAIKKETERLKEERLARMAKAREDRVSQMSVQFTDRLKQQDANGDGFLAKDEVDGRMQRRFADADKNGDGFLDATEQQAMVQGVAERMSDGGGDRRRGGGQGGNNGEQGRRSRNQ